MLEFLKRRAVRQATVATAITAVVVAIVVVCNLLLGVLGERYPLKIDLTDDQLFMLSDETLAYLDTLEDDVTVYLLSSEQAYSNSDDPYLNQANEVIQQYAANSRHIRIQYIDLMRSPGFETRFPQYQLSYTSILVTCGEQVTTLTVEDLYNTETDIFGTPYIVSSKAEQVMTSAIMSLTVNSKVTVALLSGFGEDGAEYVGEMLRTNVYHVIEQNILTEEIDPAASVLIVSNPQRDWTEDALAKLDRFLYNNGDYGRTLLFFANRNHPDTPNLDAFLAEWGIAVDEGLVYQRDRVERLAASYYWSFVDYTENDISMLPRMRSLYVIVPETRPLTALWEGRGDRKVSALLEFTDGAVVAPANAGEDWTPTGTEREGPIPALLMSQADNGFARSSVVVCGSAVAIDPTLLYATYIGNQEFFLNLVQTLSDREDNVIAITAKVIGEQALGLNMQQIMILSVILVVLVPLAVLVWGSVVYLRRRHL